jgi:hypothetical protein
VYLSQIQNFPKPHLVDHRITGIRIGLVQESRVKTRLTTKPSVQLLDVHINRPTGLAVPLPIDASLPARPCPSKPRGQVQLVLAPLFATPVDQFQFHNSQKAMQARQGIKQDSTVGRKEKQQKYLLTINDHGPFKNLMLGRR